MKIALFAITALLFFNPLIGQDSTQKILPVITIELVSSVTSDGNTILVYRRDSNRIPYQVKVTDELNNLREFYIIKHVTDIYSYLIIEKKGKEVIYYPLTWSELKDITIQDINERSKDILNGKINQVNKNNL